MIIVVFFGSAKSEATAGAVVEVFGDLIAVFLGESFEAGAPGQILAEQSVGVLVCGSFPSVMGNRKIDFDGEPGFQFFEAVEFAAVVRSDRKDPVRLARQDLCRFFQCFLAAGRW